MFYSLRSPSEMEMLSGAGASMRPLTLSPEKAQDLVPNMELLLVVYGLWDPQRERSMFAGIRTLSGRHPTCMACSSINACEAIKAGISELQRFVRGAAHTIVTGSKQRWCSRGRSMPDATIVETY